MKSRAEITTRFAKAYATARKRDKGTILDQVFEVAGRSREYARRHLVGAAKRPPGYGRQVARPERKRQGSKYSYDAVKVWQRVWAVSSGQCGKYLAVSMRLQPDLLERAGELVV